MPAAAAVAVVIDGDYPDCREDAGHEREHHLHARLRGGFFGALPALRPQRLGVDAQRLSNARSELVGLNQHRDERVQVVDAGPLGEIAQRIRAGLAGAKLEVHEPQLVRQIGIGERQLLADAGEGLVEPETRFDADDEEVQRIRERQADLVGAPLGEAREHHPREDVAEADARQRQRDVRAHDDRRREERKERERGHDADAEEDRDRLVAPVAGLDQAQAQLAHLLGRSGRLLADALEQLDERLERLALFDAFATWHQLFETPIDRDRLARHQQERSRCDNERSEDERQNWQHTHVTPRS
jgi:hypothetical protein